MFLFTPSFECESLLYMTSTLQPVLCPLKTKTPKLIPVMLQMLCLCIIHNYFNNFHSFHNLKP